MSAKVASKSSPNAGKRMSPEARARMRGTEKAVQRYYNDMGKDKGNCTWGAGILSHRGVCSEEELKKTVTAKMIDQEFERRVAEAERYVHFSVKVPVNQAQFDSLVSLTYNVGIDNMKGTYELVNNSDFEGAAENISKMIMVVFKENGKRKFVVAPGLIPRRKEESAPFRSKSEPSVDK